ncbi:MAG: DUF2088 domain-containing protein [Candidatus Dormibacteraeota bacterium]|nr:DUF2088 domain-containing protein [Candidatus Dormibacteraeota bacterium]
MQTVDGLRLVGSGSVSEPLPEHQAERLIAEGLERLNLAGRKVLVIIPDGTRTAPIPLLYRVLTGQLAGAGAQLDYLIALGTHPPMTEAAIDALLGCAAQERGQRWPRVRVFNHSWDDPASLSTVGEISAEEAFQLTDGRINHRVPVRLNRKVTEYDHIIACGPVFPHEVAGFSGGTKYLFPGIAGPEIIDFTHWLGALVTNLGTIGIVDTPVRRVIDRAAAMVRTPLTCLTLAIHGSDLHGLWLGEPDVAFREAARLSAQLNVVRLPQPVRSVLSMPSERYDDLWTAAKAMYKTEAVVADGGEVIIYAPFLKEVSFTHGRLLDQVGYHVSEYFLKQWDRYASVPGTILAHSTHVKGTGTFDAASGIERPRIEVTLATGIPEERCRRINLGYRDPATIQPEDWEGHDDRLLVKHAGEQLYRLAGR